MSIKRHRHCWVASLVKMQNLATRSNETTATELGQVSCVFDSQTVDLFILCRTLSPQESELCLIKTLALRPAMRKLVLTPTTPPGSLGLREAKVSTFDCPRTFIPKVEKLPGVRLSWAFPVRLCWMPFFCFVGWVTKTCV